MVLWKGSKMYTQKKKETFVRSGNNTVSLVGSTTALILLPHLNNPYEVSITKILFKSFHHIEYSYYYHVGCIVDQLSCVTQGDTSIPAMISIYCVVFSFCLSLSCVPYIASSLDCPFLIDPSVFSDVYSLSTHTYFFQ